MNILKEADNIVNNRSEEKTRQYGDFDTSMERMATIFNALTGLNLTAVEMYKAMVALKLSRELHAHKEDNLLDATAYIGALNNYLHKQNPK